MKTWKMSPTGNLILVYLSILFTIDIITCIVFITKLSQMIQHKL